MPKTNDDIPRVNRAMLSLFDFQGITMRDAEKIRSGFTSNNSSACSPYKKTIHMYIQAGEQTKAHARAADAINAGAHCFIHEAVCACSVRVTVEAHLEGVDSWQAR